MKTRKSKKNISPRERMRRKLQSHSEYLIGEDNNLLIPVLTREDGIHGYVLKDI